jgi:serine protease
MNRKYLPNNVIIIIFLLSISILHTAEYEKGKILIKFKSSSNEYSEWINSERNSQINEFKYLLGENNCMPFVSEAILKLVTKEKQKKSFPLSNYKNKIESLRRIALIEYTSGVNPLLVAGKLSSYDFIEYAEPVPVKKIVGVPNDSLIYRQYYLNQIFIWDAWDIVEPDSSIIIGIVDTGIDYEHEDLKDKIWVNLGETGTDKDGNDKTSNGIDDDNNGFIDDWRGWDFVSSQYTNGDNDPYPGHIHGTHVAGIAAAMTGNVRGIAGIARGASIMPVKVASDSPFNTSVSNSYEGILYAAAMGADVINCSWGSESRSESEMEILSEAIALGSVVVAAAGNDGDEEQFFPAAHKGVISVASVNFDDEKSGFSNYHFTVDVSAPGEDIYSTIPLNEYDYMDGTSMATPVASGIAALIKGQQPEYNPLQVKEHLKASCDNIDTVNPNFIGQIGRGRVNALKAVQPRELKSVILENFTIKDENDDKILDNGEKIEINISITNVLSELAEAKVHAQIISSYKPEFITDELAIGAVNTLETKDIDEPLSFIVPANLPTDYELAMEIMFFDGDDYINSEFIAMIFNPSYRTMDANDISITFNSRGNIAFNDYPSNFQGDGFHYNYGPNILYEGALMIGIPPGKVSNVARGADQMEQDNSFFSPTAFLTKNPGYLATEEGYSEFLSHETDVSLDVSVKQTVYQFDDELNKNIILCVYDIVNTSAYDYDSLYAGLYFDWDIGPSGSHNFAKFDEEYGFGYVKNKADNTLPYAGVAMISSHKLNFFAIDNPGEEPENPGVWDGFYRQEKWMMLSSGIYRKESSITDVSIVIGAGPIKLKSGDTTRVAFSIFSQYSLDLLREACLRSRETAKYYKIADGKYNPLPKNDSIVSLFPNPVNENQLNVDYLLSDGSYITIELFNSIGRKIEYPEPVNEKLRTAGYHSEKLKLPKLAQGRYYIRISTTSGRITEPFEIVY